MFFILATKSIPVPSFCLPTLFCGTRLFCKVYPEDDKPQGTDSHDVEAPKGGANVGLSYQHAVSRAVHSNGQGGEKSQNYVKNAIFEGKKAHVAVAPAPTIARRDGDGKVMTDRGRNKELELPPRHWRCIVCKKVRE